MTHKKQPLGWEEIARECNTLRDAAKDAADKIKALEAELADARKAADGWEEVARSQKLALAEADKRNTDLREVIAGLTRQLAVSDRALRRHDARAGQLTRTQRGLVAALAAAGAEIIAGQDIELDREEEG